jgi:copper chaperone CopZ
MDAPKSSKEADMRTLIGLGLSLALSGAAMAAEKSETMKVSGWHCGACSSKTESALKGLKGVKSVSSDRAKEQVTIVYDDSQVKHADLEKAITSSGFKVAN